MPHDVNVRVGVANLEVAMFWRQPLIDHFGHLNTRRTNHERPRDLFAAVTRIALDRNR